MAKVAVENLYSKQKTNQTETALKSTSNELKLCFTPKKPQKAEEILLKVRALTILSLAWGY